MIDLIEKYNIPVPRYTSYPTVPHWNTEQFSAEAYLQRLAQHFSAANASGLSLYIHLPYCESLCTYCGCNTRITVNHRVEEPYIAAVLAEWQILKSTFTEKPKIVEIHLGGGTPTFFSPDNLVKLVEGIVGETEISNHASFSFEAHPANTSFEHLLALKSIGFDRLSLGVQDFDPKVQKAINRHQTRADIERVVLEARGLGYRSVNFDLIYGLPFQTLQGMRSTIDEVLDLRPDRIAFYSYAHVPWMKPGQRAYSEADLPDAQAKLKLFTAGREMLEGGGYSGIGFDHFALPHDSLAKAYRDGKMHRNFMGFSDLRTDYLLGLGVSSISDIGHGYAQNAKSVEAYISQINQGQLPISKGHLHSEMDFAIRQHILNLTCRHTTSWADSPPVEKAYIYSKMDQLLDAEADGLLTLEGEGMKLTEWGKLLVRNMASILDSDFNAAPAVGRHAQAI